MAREVLAFFPDSETAQRALDLLRSAGLDANLADAAGIAAEGDKSEGGKLATAIAVVHPEAGEAEARSLMMQAGAIRIQGHGTESRPTGMTPLVADETPVPVAHGERVITD